MRGSTTVASVMRRIAPGDLVGPEQDLESLLQGELSGSRVFLVVEGDGVLGILVAGEALESCLVKGMTLGSTSIATGDRNPVAPSGV